MADESATAAAWTKFWEQARRQAWEAWDGLMPRAGWAPDHWQPWSDGLQRLWQANSPSLSGTEREVFAKLLDQGHGFLWLSDLVLKACEQMQLGVERGEDWQKLLRQAIDQAQEQLRYIAAVSQGDAVRWGLPAQMWERLASALAAVPGDWVQTLRQRAVGSERSGVPFGWTNPPFSGAASDLQAQAMEGASRAERYQESLLAYAGKLTEIGILALEYLYERLVERAETERPIDSLRELYDLWVDVAEQAYATVVNTPQFAATQAATVNGAMAVKQHVQTLLDEASQVCRLPTRGELDAAQRAIYELRRDVHALQEQLQALQRRATPRRRGKS